MQKELHESTGSHILLKVLRVTENEIPVALCLKVKEGFEADVSFFSAGFSAGFPNVKAGGGCSVGALGLLNEKPPVKACVESASLLAAPKRKVAGAEEVATSFFSSGLPKVNVGAVASLAACEVPRVVTTCGVLVAKLGSPNLPNTDPAAAAVVVVVALVFVDTAFLLDDALLSLFS